MIFFNQIAETWASYFGLAILQNTIFLGLVFFVLHLLRKADARIKYMIGVLGIIKLLLPPFIPGHFSWFALTEPVAQSVTVEKLISIETVVQEISMTKPSATAILFMIWIGSAALYLIISTLSTFILKLSLESAKKLPAHDSSIDLFISKNIFSPLSMGVFPNRIYVPDYWNAITEKGRKVLLQHELAHIERKDGFVQFLQTVVQAFYFFHPFVWLLNERINEYREMACDDYAIEKSSISPGDYSRYLIDIAEKITDPQWSYISASALIKQKHKLLNRVTYQLQEGTMQKRSTFKTRAALLILALLILPLSWYCSQENSRVPQAPEAVTSEISSMNTPGAAGKIWGQVQDLDEEYALPGANIIVKGTSLGAAADKDGKYFIPNIPPGSYTLEFQMIGYKTIIINDVKVAANKATNINCKLEITVVPMEKEIVTYGSERITISTDNGTEEVLVTPKTEDSPPPPSKTDQNEWKKLSTSPKPTGGFSAIQKNLRYPNLAIKAGIEGRVVINCLFDGEGNIIDTEILENIGNGDNGCAEAAIQAIKSVKWEPAKQRDKPLKVWVGIPVVFRLKDTK